MKFAIHSLFICCAFLITGCTQNTQYFTDSLNLALFGPESLSISQNKINELPYASIYVKQGDNPQALMILAWAEKDSSQFQSNPLALKYLSANHEMIVTSAGRITKTVNLLDANLSNIRSQQPDPLAIGLHDSSTPRYWEYEISWQPGYHTQYHAQSRFVVQGEEQKLLPQGARNLLHVVENVTILAIDQHYTNHYWLEPSSGEVVASEQTPAPGMARFELIVAKPFSGANKS